MTLNIIARVTPSGIVTMIIDQEVSDPTPTTTSCIQSPSFATKSDSNTAHRPGWRHDCNRRHHLDETNTFTISGIPGLNRIPLLGFAFGTRSYNKERTELIIFITPHVIYDTNQMADATDELKGRIKS